MDRKAQVWHHIHTVPSNVLQAKLYRQIDPALDYLNKMDGCLTRCRKQIH